MNVLKFGGTSVGSVKHIEQVIKILTQYSQDKKVIAVVSAVGGITDKLLNAGRLALKKNNQYDRKSIFSLRSNTSKTI